MRTLNTCLFLEVFQLFQLHKRKSYSLWNISCSIRCHSSQSRTQNETSCRRTFLSKRVRRSAFLTKNMFQLQECFTDVTADATEISTAKSCRVVLSRLLENAFSFSSYPLNSVEDQISQHSPSLTKCRITTSMLKDRRAPRHEQS